MQRHARAIADEESSPPGEPQRRELVVTVLAVGAVAIAAVLAAATHATQVGADARGVGQAPALAPVCAECGVVEAAVPMGPSAAESGPAWRMRIRMDDGSTRTVEQRGPLPAGSRVMVAGGSVRVLSSRPGQG